MDFDDVCFQIIDVELVIHLMTDSPENILCGRKKIDAYACIIFKFCNVVLYILI